MNERKCVGHKLFEDIVGFNFSLIEIVLDDETIVKIELGIKVILFLLFFDFFSEPFLNIDYLERLKRIFDFLF